MDASAITVQPIADLPQDNLQSTLSAIYGKAEYAAGAAGSAEYKADQAQAKANQLEGQIQYAADTAGFVDYHLRQIAALVGYSMPAAKQAGEEASE